MIVFRGLAAGLVAAVVASGCSLSGRSFGRYVDDSTLTATVKMKLIGQRPQALTRIDVDTFEGIVYLTGMVQDAGQKSDAEIAAWRVDGVEQVVNDLQVRETGAALPAASPDMQPRVLVDGLPGIARIDAGLPGMPGAAYDASGRQVATIYTLSMRDLAQTGFDHLRAIGRTIDHVSILPVAIAPDRPEGQYTILLWHVSPTEAAALK
jgi:hyperosmotically inducible periplasmic protein